MIKVLIIEDELDSATPLKKRLLLEIPGVEVLLATSLAGGLEEARKSLPNIVYIDAELGDSAAMETMAAIPEFKKLGAQVIATSAFQEDNLYQAAFRHGATDFIIKNTDANIPQRIIAAYFRKLYAPN